MPYVATYHGRTALLIEVGREILDYLSFGENIGFCGYYVREVC